ncbi:unnamed protein product [Darwinula stevensoni]|uniref:Uncharacterized protein n=1 Tax=Darwinula stevensoni TaxID=69355 RepID=A0A7R9FSG1_9CRUS|nr:unnamed protein product [Darwinula stevensoni]CAG0902574.1 unnamed protein product [Darwinula stevensoni]
MLEAGMPTKKFIANSPRIILSDEVAAHVVCKEEAQDLVNDGLVISSEFVSEVEEVEVLREELVYDRPISPEMGTLPMKPNEMGHLEHLEAQLNELAENLRKCEKDLGWTSFLRKKKALKELHCHLKKEKKKIEKMKRKKESLRLLMEKTTKLHRTSFGTRLESKKDRGRYESGSTHEDLDQPQGSEALRLLPRADGRIRRVFVSFSFLVRIREFSRTPRFP